MVRVAGIVVITVLFSVLGDLFESLIKREQGSQRFEFSSARSWWCDGSYRLINSCNAGICIERSFHGLAVVMTIGVALFGATGSIGESTLSVIEAYPERFHLEVVSAHSSVEKLVRIIERFRPKHVILSDQSEATAMIEKMPSSFNGSLAFGESALTEAASAPEVDVVMAAIVGGAGLVSTYAAVTAGKRVCVANKEALVMGGQLMMSAAETKGAMLLPIDSEHNAIFQCLPDSYVVGQPISGLKRLVLTCSGGPFREWSIDAMAAATPNQAVAHPNWSMGRKISVDSATLMNKGLELIEATHLFMSLKVPLMWLFILSRPYIHW